jgi:hypothetical protein
MAEVDTMMLSNQHSDIRREAAEHTNEIVKEGIKESFNIRGDVKDARYDLASRVESGVARTIADVDRNADRLDTRFFDVARDTQDIRAQVISAQQAMVTGFLGVSKDTEIAALKTQMETAKQTTYLSDKIDSDGERTRSLINDLKYQDLNRGLIERNTALVEAVGDGRYWRHRGYLDQGQNQFAQLQTQLQAFGSQLQETRQGMVNFGTMAGVGQTSSSNNV